MPTIQEYFAGTNIGLQPSEVGIEATQQTGRYAKAFYNQWAEGLRNFGDRAGQELGRSVQDAGNAAYQFAEHQDISHGGVAYAGAYDRLTQAWNDTVKNADPNDPTVAAKFRENVLEPELEKFNDGFLTEGGQKWAQTHVNELRQHMFEKTAADMSTLAGVAVARNVRQMANSMSNTAMNDPSSVDHLIDAVSHSVGGMVDSSPNLKGTAAAAAKTEVTEKSIEAIVKSGAQGAIEKAQDPEAVAEQWGKKYPKYISGEELKTLSTFARSQIRARHTDDAYVRHLDALDRADRDDAAKSDVLKKLYSDDPQERASVSAKSIVNNPNLKPATAENLIRLQEREMKPETERRISERTTVGLLRQLYSPDADPDAVLKAATEARLKEPGSEGSQTQQDFNTVRTEIAARKTPEGLALASDRNEFFKRYATTIDPNVISGNDPSTKMYAAEMEARRQEAVLRKAGQDPHSLYDPASPNFFGKQLGKFTTSLQDAMKAKAQDLSVTGPGKTETGTSIITLPPGMSPAEAIAKGYGGKTVRLPDGRVRELPKTLPPRPKDEGPQVPMSR